MEPTCKLGTELSWNWTIFSWSSMTALGTRVGPAGFVYSPPSWQGAPSGGQPQRGGRRPWDACFGPVGKGWESAPQGCRDGSGQGEDPRWLKGGGSAEVLQRRPWGQPRISEETVSCALLPDPKNIQRANTGSLPAPHICEWICIFKVFSIHFFFHFIFSRAPCAW